MATRRRTLIEGASFGTRTPAVVRTMNRAIHIVEPPTIQTHTVVGGVPVSDGPPKADLTRVRSGLQPGMLVVAYAPLSSFRNYPSFSVELPDNSYDVNRITAGARFLRVAQVSTCGKFFRGQALACAVYTARSDGTLLPKSRRVLSSTGHCVYDTHPWTAENIQGGLRSLEVELAAGDTLHRVCHIKQAYSLADLPVALTTEWRRLIRARAIQSLNERLAPVDPARNPLRYRSNPASRLSAAKIIRAYLTQLGGMDIARVVANIANQLQHAYALDQHATAVKIVNRALARRGDPQVEFFACGHYGPSGSGTELLRHPGASAGLFCEACCGTNTMVTALDGDGVEFNAHSHYVHEWADGSYHTEPEPRIINGYHASKKIVGFVPPLVNVGKDFPTLGFELEVQGATSTIRDDNQELERIAKQMRSRLDGLMPEAMVRKYLSFEYDGSVTGGFEAVTGWTDLATHRTLVRRLLLDENGANPWAGQLRSHNASGQCCGLHVHVSKPKSLLHAAKIKYLMNSPLFAELITSVARRYNTNYARVGAWGRAGPEKHAARMMRDQKRMRPSSDMKSCAKRAVDQMSEVRYEIANFTNPATIEIRAFRGSTLFGSVMACIEFVQAIWYYCRFAPAQSLTPQGFVEFINQSDNATDTRELRKYLDAKGFPGVRVGKPNKLVAQVADTADVE
jgi:hypothetical protein